MRDKLSVLLTTEGTYPFHQGGVSTWCDMLVKGLTSVDFSIVSIITDPFVTQKYSLPKGTKLLRIPLWGTDEPSEHLSVPFSSTYLAKQRTTPAVIQERFIPIFEDFIRQIFARTKDSWQMGEILVRFYDFFQQFDYKVAFKSQLTWERYRVLVSEEVAKENSGFDEPDIYSLIQSLGWLYRFFNIINTNVPKTHVCHSTAAAFCGIPCVISKLKYGTPFLLTEHGVYLREQYLSLSKRGYSSFLNTFLIRMIWSVTYLNYNFADQISPVCEYNTRWERRITDGHERIRVIYNGVDHKLFERIQPRDRSRPTVVTVARIDPIKDLLTLIRTAGEVRNVIPDVQFLVYGGVSVQAYYEDCVRLIHELSLESTVVLKGHTADMVAAYDSGDIVLQTSISEGFPYSIIEAMLSGKPVVATRVGGVAEAVGQTGTLLNPGDVDGLSKAVVQLLESTQARLELGEESRRRALDLFTVDRTLRNYMRSYLRITIVERDNRPFRQRVDVRPVKRNTRMPVQQKQVVPSTVGMSGQLRRKLAMQRALALLASGYPVKASTHLKNAIRANEDTLADTVKLELLFSVYQKLNYEDEARHVRDRLMKSADAAVTRWQQLLVEKAFAFEGTPHRDKAIRYLKEAIALKPNAPGAAILMSELSLLMSLDRDIEQAREYYTKSILLSQVFSAKAASE